MNGKSKFLPFQFRNALATRTEEQPDSDMLLDAAIKECRKEKLSYKLEAVRSTAIMLNELGVDRFQDFWSVLLPVLKKVQR